MTLLVALCLAIVAISFFCSLLEATLLSISPAFVAVMVKEGRKSGKLLEHLKDNINRPITAILTLNTISHTLGAAAVGAMVHEMYGSAAVTTSSVILTLIILIFSEILPKILGTMYWKSIAPFSAYAIQLLIFLMYPIVRFSEVLSSGFKESEDATVTREEIMMNVEMGVDEGTLHKKESAIIKNLLMLNSVYVSDIMTPRSVFFAMDSSLTVEQVNQKYKPIRFSRIPVFDGNLDHIVGLTFRHKILEALSSDLHDLKIKNLTSPINTVSERMSVASVIDFFVKKKEHLALAVDEYGIITGLVTLEDAIETLLGVEIVDELDSITDMRQYAIEQWQIRKNQIRRGSLP